MNKNLAVIVGYMMYYNLIEDKINGSFFSRLWNCRIWKFHKWTCNHEQGIKPTKEQLENGIEGFYDYAKMYCKICGTESKLSKKIRCKYKN